MTEKEIVTRFFIEGYVNRNFDLAVDCMAEDYFDHSPAGARSNRAAGEILKIVAGQYQDMKLTILDIFSEGCMVATRIRFDASCGGKKLSFEALENFKVENGKITESWGYWPDKQIEEMLK